MKAANPPLVRPLLLAAGIAGLGTALAQLPGIHHLGPLTLTLLLGFAWRSIGRPGAGPASPAAFPTNTLLRAGIVLLGSRLDLTALAGAGIKMLLLDTTVVLAGLTGITWLGRRLGLEPRLACLIAVGSSICGASAVAATAPVLRARDDETATAIAICSVVGTVAMLGFTLAHGLVPIPHTTYGLITGATLHEVAQVMAAVNPVPAAAEIGTMTKLLRVVLLVPVVFGVNRWTARRIQAGPEAGASVLPRPWFVLGFLGMGTANTLARRFLPVSAETLDTFIRPLPGLAGLLLAMAMAGMGQQIDPARLRASGRRTFVTAALGWGGLAVLAGLMIWILNP